MYVLLIQNNSGKQKKKEKNISSTTAHPHSGQFIANEVRTSEQQHTLQYGTSVLEMT